MEIIHSDLHRLKVRSCKGGKYWITFIDECTELCAVMFLKRNSDAFDAFKTFKACGENALDRKIKCFHDDKGGKHTSNAITSVYYALAWNGKTGDELEVLLEGKE